VKVLDLFSGLNGWSDPMEARGHEVFRIDIDQQFEADAYLDIADVDAVLAALPWKPDLVLASPPCTGFTVMNIGKNWTHDGTPKTPVARLALRLVNATLEIIDRLQPELYVFENPRAKLRSLPNLKHLTRAEVTYCRLGERRMKPTDLWFSDSWADSDLILPEACKNGNPDHISAPRGSTTGTQGMDPVVVAKIPKELSELVCDAAERHFVKTRGWA